MSLVEPNVGSATLADRVIEEIRVLMARRRMSGVALANAVGKQPSTINRKLQGRIPIDLQDLEDIAHALGVDALALVEAALEQRHQANAAASNASERHAGGRRGARDRAAQRGFRTVRTVAPADGLEPSTCRFLPAAGARVTARRAGCFARTPAVGVSFGRSDSEQFGRLSAESGIAA